TLGECVGDRVEMRIRVPAEHAQVAARRHGEGELARVDRSRNADLERFASRLVAAEFGEQPTGEQKPRRQGRIGRHDGRRPARRAVPPRRERVRERSVHGGLGGGTGGELGGRFGHAPDLYHGFWSSPWARSSASLIAFAVASTRGTTFG